MDQVKIGKFISDMRKEKGITQSDLAEQLNITDRAISKWENGKCLPDASTMIPLCKILGISINELFYGEKINMENEKKITETNLLEMAKKNEFYNKMMLTTEVILIIVIISIMGLAALFVGYANTTDEIKCLVAAVSTIISMVLIMVSVFIEYSFGCYECKHCHHKFVPTFKQFIFSQHMGFSHKLKCPECGKKSYCKKVTK